LSDDLHACCQVLTEGACDFLLCYRHRSVPLTLDEAAFARVDLGTERLLPVCVPDPEGQPRWRLPGDERARIPHLAYTRGSFLGAVVDDLLKRSKPALDVRHTDAFAQALKSLAMRGCGVAWLPESSIAASLQAGDLAIAGDERWEQSLSLSIFAAPDRLDGIGMAMWKFFSGATASAPKSDPAIG
ncbi:MAG TPA: LysR substrate-binding domain-containing protein, partial [Thermohalobaculum sp.]|nr:LysR substrate-binding domain-containing protein [Thermohalobaculum sp.]